MKNKLKRFVPILLSALLISPLGISASAAESIDIERTGSITLNLKKGAGSEGAIFEVLKVADVATDYMGNMLYQLTDDFSQAPVTNDMLNVDQDSFDTVAANYGQLFGRYAKDTEKHGFQQEVNEEGQIEFNDMDCGLYLIRQVKAGTGYQNISSFLVSVPYLEDDEYIYDVTANVKVLLMVDPDDPDRHNKPGDPEYEKPDDDILDDGNPDNPPSGDDDEPGNDSGNNDDENKPNTPSTPSNGGNTGSPSSSGGRPTSSSKLPQTGQLWWPVFALSISGMILFAIGWIRRRNSENG